MAGELNLAPKRGTSNVWDRRSTWQWSQPAGWLCLGAGAALVAAGAWKRSAPATLGAMAGTLLAYRAVSGRNDAAVIWDGLTRLARSLGLGDRDVVAEASADSFPASDAPSWMT